MVTVERSIENGVEIVETSLPVLLTVDGTAAQCRPANAYRLLRFHRAAIPTEQAAKGFRYSKQIEADEALALKEWNLVHINGDAARCGLAGSPTKVRKVDNVIFKAKESKRYSAGDEDIKALVGELLANHTIG